MTEPANIFSMAAEPPEEGAKTFKMEVDTSASGIDLMDHQAEAKALRQDEEESGVHVPPKPERVTEPTRNPAIEVNPVDELKTLVDQAFSDTYEFGKVEVSAEERQRFVRAALHDNPMWFDIMLEGVGIVVRVVIPPEPFTTAAANAVTEWGKRKTMDPDSNLQWYLAFQQIHAWYQVREIEGVATEWSSMFEDGNPKHSEIRKFINEPDNFEVFFNMSAVKWRMIVEAMRMAEAKYKICVQAWRDKSFFTSAGTA